MAAKAAAPGAGTLAGSFLPDHEQHRTRQQYCQKVPATLSRHNQRAAGSSAAISGKRLDSVDLALEGVQVSRRSARGVCCSASLNDAAVETAPQPTSKIDIPSTSLRDSAPPSDDDIQDTSVFITDVANLVKLVDSRDIVELELKHKNYEILIRKKEALPQPAQSSGYQTFPGPHVMAHTSMPQQAFYQAAPQPMPAAPAAAAAPATSAAPSMDAAPAAQPKSSLPPMLSPMAGTFYRSPAPGEPPFVKIGDRVQKGQVVCIVEAMKLMNEIEVDQSGVIVDILLDDKKPVAIDTPLFIIQP